MLAKTLIEVDVRIAILREQIGFGEENAAATAEVQQLLKRREELIPQMVAERSREFAFAA